MLVACNDCGKRAYTEESPLWYLCDYCLTHSTCRSCGKSKETKKMFYGICKLCAAKEEKEIMKEMEITCCDGCGLEYRTYYLEYNSLWNGLFCPECLESEVG